MNDLLCNEFDPITIGHCIGEMVEKEAMNFTSIPEHDGHDQSIGHHLIVWIHQHPFYKP
jgi:hypothetical protein